MYDIFWDNGNDFNLNNASMGGALKGLVAMRDGNNNKAFGGRLVACNTYNKTGSPCFPLRIVRVGNRIFFRLHVYYF